MKLFIVACLAVAAMAESNHHLYNGIYHQTGFPLVNTYMPHTYMPSQPIVSPFSYIQPSYQQIMKEQVEKKENVEVTEKKVEVEKMPQQIVYSNSPLATQYITPFHQVQPVVVGPRYVAKNGQVEHIVHKREADALNVFSPYHSAVYPSVYNRYAGVIPTNYYSNKATFFNPYTHDVTGKVANDAVLPTNYAGKGTYFARAPGSNTVHVAKREADPLTVYHSNPMMYNNPMMYSGFYNGLSTPYLRTVATPIVKSVAQPIVYNAPTGLEGVVNGKTVADDAWQFTPNYAGKGMYEAKTPGTTHRARRDADPLTIYRTHSLYNNYYPRTAVASPFYNSVYPVVRTTPFLNYYY